MCRWSARQHKASSWVQGPRSGGHKPPSEGVVNKVNIWPPHLKARKDFCQLCLTWVQALINESRQWLLYNSRYTNLITSHRAKPNQYSRWKKKTCPIRGATPSPSLFSEIKPQIILSQAAMFWDYEHEWLLPSRLQIHKQYSFTKVAFM